MQPNIHDNILACSKMIALRFSLLKTDKLSEDLESVHCSINTCKLIENGWLQIFVLHV